MRTSNWLIWLLIIGLVIFFFYQLFYNVFPQMQAINNQQPNRPSVEETLSRLDNGRAATLDAEDYDDEDGMLQGAKNAAGALTDGVAATGTAVAGGVASAGTLLKNGATAATGTLSEGATALREKAAEAVAATPSIDDLVSLKEDQARQLENASNRSSTTPVGYNSVPDGPFMLVAGTYRQMINAEQELKKLKKMGYDNATIAKFNNSTYASLIVDRFASSSEAYAYLKVLKKNGLDVYVHKKR